MQHRGPDDFGIELYEIANALIGFGQARLSIIDLSSAGHQPMNFGHLSIVFNGEIYNYKEVRCKLIEKGRNFDTNSDTEVILQSFDEWGIKCVHEFIGMFAFVILNKKENKVFVFRDRVGVKPFHYYYQNGLFLFGSELKALMANPNFQKTIDESVLFNYLESGYISAPSTIFKNTYKLKPGNYMVLDLISKELKIQEYWTLHSYYLLPKLDIEYEEIKYNVKTLMDSAFEYRMVSDVPVGVFLSGGYDSTAVTAMLQSTSSKPLKTFTIGFEERNNEAPHAKNTADFLGTDHTEHICTTKEAKEIIPLLPFFFDEPFGDSSAIPTILVSQLARQQVTVALSADAGDEVFCGYNSYFSLYANLKKLDSFPNILKSRWLGKLGKLLKTNDKINLNKTIHQISSSLAVIDKETNYKAADLFTYMSEKPRGYIKKLFNKDFTEKINKEKSRDFANFANPLEVAMLMDFESYLPNDILTKVDRATMSVSLEGREPLLDHRLVAYAAQIPIKYKTNGEDGKLILKDIVHDYVPKEMMERPKTGFSLPIYKWLREDLSYLLDEYLSENAIKASGLFNAETVLEEVQEFKNKKLHYTPIIWNLLMFQMWYFKWMTDE